MARNKILIGVSTGEYARRADFYDYYNLLKKPEGTMSLFCHDRSPAHGRNKVIEAAKQENCTHLLLIDDDMAYREDALEKLLEHDVDIVSGLYLSRAYPHTPLAFDIADEMDGSAGSMYLTTDDKRRLVPIVAAGFGFCLFKMLVFERMEQPYVRLGELNAEQWCDDIGFFNRARLAGIKSYVDMECLLGHMGTMIIWPNRDSSGQWFAGYDTNGKPGMVNVPLFFDTPKYQIESGAK